MYKFNNDNIITGYIKQLLHSFNLPTCRIFDTVDGFLNYYPSEVGVTGIIKNYKNNSSYLLYKEGNEIKREQIYALNHSYLNITTNLGLFNGIYDSSCHKYLGDFLRFIRDYLEIDLMGLYNCFANEILVDSQYKYIIIPVKHNTNYTVAFDGKDYDYLFTYENKLEKIAANFKDNNYKNKPSSGYKTRTSTFLSPFLLTSLIGEDMLITEGVNAGKKIYSCFKEQLYKLVIRVKVTDNPTITVLEGDYTKAKQEFAPICANFEKGVDYSNVNLNNYLSDLQLLDFHLGQKDISYPFADKLLEYLTGIAITPDDLISQNIIDAKTKFNSKFDFPVIPIDGKFTTNDRLRYLDLFSRSKYWNKKTYDLLGYIDKEIEECLDDETLKIKGVD
mgnify:CR=1 FL=1